MFRDDDNDWGGGACFWIVVGIGLVFLFTNLDTDGDGDLGGLRPESAIVKQCPAVFDANNESVLIAGCKADACGGFIEWCGLSSTNYSLTLSLAGDYNGKF